MNCPICSQPGRSWGVKNDYALERCPRCLHLYATRTPTACELTRLYDQYSYREHGLHAVSPFILARLRELLAPLLRPGRNRLLDVGFGAGALLMAAAELGFEAQGIETSPLAVEQARARGFRVEQADFLQMPWEADSFDVVCMVELLEHVPDPIAFLRKARRVLSPGGRLFLTTPNGAGLSARVLHEQWSVVAPPEHLQLFSARSIGRALQAAGFERLRIRSEGLNPTELIAGFRSRAPQRRVECNRVASAQALNERLTRDRLGRAVKATANVVLTLAGCGDSLKVLAEVVEGAPERRG